MLHILTILLGKNILVRVLRDLLTAFNVKSELPWYFSKSNLGKHKHRGPVYIGIGAWCTTTSNR